MDKRGINSRLRTVAGKFSIGELCVCAEGLDILKNLGRPKPPVPPGYAYVRAVYIRYM